MNIRVWGEVAGVVGVFVLLTVVIAVAITQVAATWRAKEARLRSVEKVLKEVG